MIRETTYHPQWQINRINFILSKYPKEFFIGKRILELGAFNGYIGAYFKSIGASEVHCVEGREENLNNITKNYPDVTAELYDLDTPNWNWGKWDIIINFGLYYHLEKFHKEHLKNCLDNCDMMFFESVIYDSNESEIYFKNERGADQSLSDVGGSPSTSYVEDIFKENLVTYQKYSESSLNAYKHNYDWPDTGNKVFHGWRRRFWIVNH